MTTFTPIIVTISTDQRAIEIPEGMVIEKRLPDLLALLESHSKGALPLCYLLKGLITNPSPLFFLNRQRKRPMLPKSG